MASNRAQYRCSDGQMIKELHVCDEAEQDVSQIKNGKHCFHVACSAVINERRKSCKVLKQPLRSFKSIQDKVFDKIVTLVPKANKRSERIKRNACQGNLRKMHGHPFIVCGIIYRLVLWRDKRLRCIDAEIVVQQSICHGQDNSHRNGLKMPGAFAFDKLPDRMSRPCKQLLKRIKDAFVKMKKAVLNVVP